MGPQGEQLIQVTAKELREMPLEQLVDLAAQLGISIRPGSARTQVLTRLERLFISCEEY